jgi:hypothetical protein
MSTPHSSVLERIDQLCDRYEDAWLALRPLRGRLVGQNWPRSVRRQRKILLDAERAVSCIHRAGGW